MPPHHYSDINPQPWKLQRRVLLTGIVILGAGTLIGGNSHYGRRRIEHA